MSDNRHNLLDAPAEQPLSAAPTVVECLEEVNRLVHAGALEIGSRAHSLLTYLIEHYQKSGPDVPIKAYSIAVDVLHRPSSFDPTRDSIVRVEVGRLRKLLDMYFLGPGASDPTQFSIPRGQSHLKVIRLLSESATQTEGTGTGPDRFAAVRRLRARHILISTLIILSLCLTYGALHSRNGAADVEAALTEEFPRLFVNSFQKDSELADAFPKGAFSSFLAAELSEFKTFRVIGPSFPTTLQVRQRDYVLDGTILRKDAAKPQLFDLRLTLNDGFGTLLWADTLSFNVEDWGSAEPVLQATSSIASILGGSMGVIDSVGRARLDAEMIEWRTGRASEFRCLMIWQSYDLTKGLAERYSARHCLEHLASTQSRVSQIWSALGFSRLLDWIAEGADPKSPLIHNAVAAASRAVLLDPEGADGHEALGSILTALGLWSEAREALEKAKQVNPSNLETIVKLGWLDCLEGDWQTGRERIQSVIARYSVVPGWYRLPLALLAFRDGETAEMLRQAKAIIATGDERGLSLAIVAARLMGDSQEEAAHLAALRATGKDLPQVIAELAAIFPHPDLMGSLLVQAK